MTVPLWLGAFADKSDAGRSGGDPRGRARPPVVQPAYPAAPDPEAALVAALRDADETVAREAFETVFRTYYPILCDFAARYVSAHDIASEVVSDVFVRVWERRVVWELRGTLRAYLYGAVANAARNRRRDIEREDRRAERSVAGGADPAWMGTRDVTPEMVAVSSDTRDRLWATVEALGDDGLVLLLRWRYALDYDAIARTLGVSAAAAQRRHSRALERLRATLPDLFRDDVG